VYARAVKRLPFAAATLIPLIFAACGGGSTGPTGASSSSASSSSSSASSSSGAGGAGGAAPAACTQTTFGGTRPVTLHVPASYDCDAGAPLVILLHGYSASGAIEELYLNVTAESNKRGFLYAHPDGLKDATSLQFWNATDACCDFTGPDVDDSAYLDGLVHEIEAAYHVDPKRVYFVGHSNGAFMSYRMACDHAGEVAAIASLAGAMWADLTRCTPADPVSVLEIHGTADAVIAYNGGSNVGHPYPAAETSVSDWATFDKCAPTPDTSLPPIDIEATLPGAETTITRWGQCEAGTEVQLWTIQGGSHVPTFPPAFLTGVFDFLYAHPKP